MDIVTIAAIVTDNLAPALPYLGKHGEDVAKKAVSELGRDSWELAKRLWQHLQPKIGASDAAYGAIAKVAKAPNDADAQEELKLQIEKILDKDEALAVILAELIQHDAAKGGMGIAVGAVVGLLVAGPITGYIGACVGSLSGLGGAAITNKHHAPGDSAPPPPPPK